MTGIVKTLSIIAGTAFAVIAIHSTAMGADFSFGAMTWYSWWVPPFISGMKGGDDLAAAGGKIRMKDSTFLYGPMMTLKTGEQWSIAAVFCFNRHPDSYRARSSFLGINASGLSLLESLYGFPPYYLYYAKARFDRIDRYDLDLTVNYSINRAVKIFAGFKYQGYEYEGKARAFFIQYAIPFFETRMSVKYHSFGAGTGPALTLHLVENLYLIANASGFIMYATGKKKTNRDPEPIRGLVAGGNAQVALAYYFDKARTTLSLGYRGQVANYYRTDFTRRHEENMSYNHGMTLSLVYAF